MPPEEARAEAVREYLLANMRDLPATDVDSVGYGESRPVANNETVEGRATTFREDFMANQYGSPSDHIRSVSAKDAYSKKARKKLVESRAKLFGVRTALKSAITTGRLKSSDKLQRAQRAMEMRLTTAESRFESLQKSGEEEWEQRRDELENAWEDLSHAINKLVARVKDESR